MEPMLIIFVDRNSDMCVMYNLCIIIEVFSLAFVSYNPLLLITQKTKRAPKVETGTRNVDASMDEWLEVGTSHLKAYLVHKIYLHFF